jgi:hypothetical protein
MNPASSYLTPSILQSLAEQVDDRRPDLPHFACQRRRESLLATLFSFLRAAVHCAQQGFVLACSKDIPQVSFIFMDDQDAY